MGETTGISWADKTQNFWEGCTKVGPGCDGCYAEARNARFGGGTAPNWGPGAPRRRTSEHNWNEPRRWNRRAAAAGERPFVFCSSLADFFDNEVPQAIRNEAWEVIFDTPHLVWLMLTKRIGNVASMMHPRGWPPNAAMGATFVNQAEWLRDRWKLKHQAKANGALFTFGSFEPLLGLIDFEGAWMPDWVIVGGESSQAHHRARPCHPWWVDAMKAQAETAGKIFHFKQWGSWAPALVLEGDENSPAVTMMDAAGRRLGVIPADSEDAYYFVHTTPEDAGRELYGRVYDGRPEVPAYAA